jgi:hypothetical protein
MSGPSTPSGMGTGTGMDLGAGKGTGTGSGAGADLVSFHVDLDRLLALQSRLGALHMQLESGPTHPRALEANLNPGAGSSNLLMRGNQDDVARFAYGLLDESDPLGYTHAHVTGSVLGMVTALTNMVEGLIAIARKRGATYEEAEATITRLAAEAASVTSGAGAP